MPRGAPVTLALVGALWALGAATSSLLSGPEPLVRGAVGVGVGTVAGGAWWTPLTSLLWCANLASYLVATLLLVVVLAPVERRLGSTRTGVLLIAAQLLGTAVAAGLVAVTAAVPDEWAQRMATELAVGPTGAVLGVALAFTGRLGVLWRRRLRLVLLVGLVMAALYSGSWPDVLRLATGVGGLTLGALLLDPHGPRPRSRGPHWTATGPEIRVLLALIVAASAGGPLLAAVSGTAIGPLSVLRYLVLDPAPDPATIQAVCADPTVGEDCADLRSRQRLGGVGPAVLSLLPVLLLLVLADGLRRARRFAWWGTLGLNLGFAGLAAGLVVLTTAVPAERLVAFGATAASTEFRAGLVAAVAQPLAVVALLQVTRRRFTVTASARTYRRWVATVGGAFIAAALVYLAGGYLARAGFTPQPGWMQLLADLPTRFLPPGYLGQLEIAFLPVTVPATVLYEWTGVAFWMVTLAASVRVLHCAPAVPDDAATARTLLRRYGGSSLSWMTTWPGQRYWLHPTNQAGVAYRVIGRVALSTGEPFGVSELRLSAADGFARFCAEHAWMPCLYSVGEPVRAHTERRGWTWVQVGEETVVPLTDLTFAGRRWQDVRSALNSARRAGVSAEWVDYGRAPLAIGDQIRAISEEWVTDKGLPEMGFTLGGLDELADPQVRCLVAVDADRTVHGVTGWLPVYGGAADADCAADADWAAGRRPDHGDTDTDTDSDGVVVGWTLDFMRRRDSGFRPTMEFLIASAALRFQQEGARFVSLSGVPLARRDRGEPTDGLQGLLDRLGESLEPVYGFRSLLAFKAKFQPEYRPLYLTYPDPTALPAVAIAITRAYLPDLTPTRALAVLRRLRRARATRQGTPTPDASDPTPNSAAPTSPLDHGPGTPRRDRCRP